MKLGWLFYGWIGGSGPRCGSKMASAKKPEPLARCDARAWKARPSAEVSGVPQ